jgi:hypothetical protein
LSEHASRVPAEQPTGAGRRLPRGRGKRHYYTFGTSAEARSALAAASSGMKSCQATSRALQVTSHITPDAVSHKP